LPLGLASTEGLGRALTFLAVVASAKQLPEAAMGLGEKQRAPLGAVALRLLLCQKDKVSGSLVFEASPGG